jgi:hypothetical protein
VTLSWTVFVDRCLGGRRMKPMLIEAGWSVVLHDEVFEQDAPDVEWLPVVAASGQVVLTRDKQIRRRPDELLAMMQSGSRVVFIGFEGNMRSYVSALLAGSRRLQQVFDAHAPPVAVKLHRDGAVDVVPVPAFARDEP